MWISPDTVRRTSSANVSGRRSMLSTRGRAMRRRRRPAAVSAMRGPRRTNNAVRNSSSRARICRDTAGCVRDSRSAALDMLCSCAAWQNARSCRTRSLAWSSRSEINATPSLVRSDYAECAFLIHSNVQFLCITKFHTHNDAAPVEERGGGGYTDDGLGRDRVVRMPFHTRRLAAKARHGPAVFLPLLPDTRDERSLHGEYSYNACQAIAESLGLPPPVGRGRASSSTTGAAPRPSSRDWRSPR